MFWQPDWVTIIDLLLRGGPAGWTAVVLGTLGPAALGYWGGRRVYGTRPTTHALIGGDGKFAPQDTRDVDALFATLDKGEERLQGMVSEPAKATRLAKRLIDECRDLYRLNIAFRTQAGRAAYLDRLDERRARIANLHQSLQRRIKDVA